MKPQQLIYIDALTQTMQCFFGDDLKFSFPVSTGENGMGELEDSGCTPRGWHIIHNIIGREHSVNSVFVARKWTGEIYNEALARENPGRDWVLTRIIQLEGDEPGRNKGPGVDSLSRYIYIHGTPDSTKLGRPASKGCIRVGNQDIIKLCDWIANDAKIYIQ